jgi:hypothetical protein
MLDGAWKIPHWIASYARTGLQASSGSRAKESDQIPTVRKEHARRTQHLPYCVEKKVGLLLKDIDEPFVAAAWIPLHTTIDMHEKRREQQVYGKARSDAAGWRYAMLGIWIGNHIGFAFPGSLLEEHETPICPWLHATRDPCKCTPQPLEAGSPYMRK